VKTLTILNSYQLHENDFKTITEYISPIQSHDSVYSPQIAKNLLNSGIGFESLCKNIGKLVGQDIGNISQYKEVILTKFPKIVDFEVQLTLTHRIIKPLENWKNGNLNWWDSYTKLKHNYFENLNYGCLGEALNAISAYLVLILYFGYLENKNVFPDIPSSLGPSLLSPKDYSNSSFESGGFYLQYPLLL
jgi:hypothetical protein